MNLAEIVDSQSVLPSLKAQNKKQLLQEIAHAAGKHTAIDHRVIFET
ncbi:MAG: transcriptional regulator, partial [Alphaproteobacteria bacterium]